MATVLIVDDEGKMRALLAMALDSQGYAVEEAESSEKALDTLKRLIPDVMITDIRLPGMSGLDLLRRVRQSHPEITCIVMTAHADAKSGIEAMRAGALEYVAKPFEMDHMLLLVKSALDKTSLQREVTRLREAAAGSAGFERVIAVSRAMQEVIALARVVAPRETTVLVRGPSGTGKELIARGIHTESGRRTFVPINCGALPETLLESELFGYEKGAFTGAGSQKIGLFEKAGEGTVFLDEIGDISQNMQVKLLRVLQEREFTRVGGTEVIRTQARVIAATNRDLEEAVKARTFREDLFYRLNVFPIVIPPLVRRPEDIPALVDSFFVKYKHTAGITPDALAVLERHGWPGNVRELENCIERAIIMAGGQSIQSGHLPESVRLSRPAAGHVFSLPAGGVNLDDVEKSLILQALEMGGGNKTRAAELLGISRRAIYSKMKTHGIQDQEGGEEPA